MITQRIIIKKTIYKGFVTSLYKCHSRAVSKVIVEQLVTA